MAPVRTDHKINEKWLVRLKLFAARKQESGSDEQKHQLLIQLLNSQLDNKCVGSVESHWIEPSLPSQVKYEDNALVATGVRAKVTVPLTLPDSLAFQMKSKASTSSTVQSLRTPDWFGKRKTTEASQTAHSSVLKQLQSLCTAAIEHNNLPKPGELSRILDEAIWESAVQLRVLPSLQMQLVTFCSKSKSVADIGALIKSRCIVDERAIQGLTHLIEELGECNLWSSLIDSATAGLPERALVAALKDCVWRSGLEEWDRLLVKTVKQKFNQLVLAAEFKTLEPDDALLVVKRLKERLVDLSTDHQIDTDLYDKLLSWICAVLDAHGGTMGSDDRLNREVTELHDIVSDTISLLSVSMTLFGEECLSSEEAKNLAFTDDYRIETFYLEDLKCE